MPVSEERLTASTDVRRIVQGEALSITVEVYDEVSSRALDLEGATEVVATFAGTPEADGTPTTVTATLTGATIALDTAGRLTVTLDAAKTAALRVGEAQAWQLNMTLADGSIRIVQIVEQLDVLPSLF